MAPYTLIFTGFLALVAAQTPGQTPEVHPKVTTWKCTQAGGCTEQTSALVLDSAAHPIHQANNTAQGCVSLNSTSTIDPTVCPDEATCAKNCIMEGIQDYSNYGVLTNGSAITLNMLAKSGKDGVASPRIYLLEGDEQQYEVIQLTGNEFSFDVDVSKLPCGMNGALYMSEMEANGGKSDLNPGGAAYGTGYCDAQCYATPWIEGVGNVKSVGACCNELDIWEANKRSTQVAPHPCSISGLYRCTGNDCGATGVCDKSGCHKRPYTFDKSYYAPASHQVDTNRPFTVVTQFPATNGVLTSIVRKYVQDGRVIEDAAQNVTITDPYCSSINATVFENLGGIKEMGESMSRGMILIMSIWWDETGFMNWLDTGNSGPCNTTEGDPKIIELVEPAPSVVFSQIKWGEIGSTFASGSGYIGL